MLETGVRVEIPGQREPPEHKGKPMGALARDHCWAAPGLVAEMQVIEIAEDEECSMSTLHGESRVDAV